VGEVYRPEDIVGGKKRSSDLSPNLNGVAPSIAGRNERSQIAQSRS